MVPPVLQRTHQRAVAEPMGDETGEGKVTSKKDENSNISI
jgi:hypothetical protein